MNYVLNSMIWSAGGFAFGWFFSSLYCRWLFKTKNPYLHESIAFRWLGIVIAFMAVATSLQVWQVNSRLTEESQCLAEYQDHVAEVTNLRAELADQDRRALNDMLIGLYENRDATPEERLALFENWVETTRRTEQERRENPLPSLPSYACNERGD